MLYPTIKSLMERGQLPKGNYGVQLGDFNFATGQIAWCGAQWDLATTEDVALRIANQWRQEGIEKVAQTAPKIELVGRAHTSPERLAPFYKPVKLGR